MSVLSVNVTGIPLRTGLFGMPVIFTLGFLFGTFSKALSYAMPSSKVSEPDEEDTKSALNEPLYL